MTYGQAYALAARNAKACEEAQLAECRCVCGGRFHGKAHAPVFIAEYAARLTAEAAVAAQQRELELC